MTDEAARLASVLGAMPSRAPEAVRERALAQAMAAFDRCHQGAAEGAAEREAGEADAGDGWASPRNRQRGASQGRVPRRGTSWIRDLAMTPLRLSFAAAGGVAALAIAGVVAHWVLFAPLPEQPMLPSAPTSVLDRDHGAEPALSAPGLPENPQLAESHIPERQRTLGRQRIRERQDAQVLAHALGGASVDEAPALAHGRDRFERFDESPVKVVAEAPVSTFSIDVDTASYSFVRAALSGGARPVKDAVRVEELVNYFPYEYAPPETRETPFATAVSVLPAPWNGAAQLMHIGIKGYVLERESAPRANLVFLIDTSGSMQAPNKLPLLVSSFKLLLGTLAPEDRVAIVTYAGTAGVALEPTLAADRAAIHASLDRLGAGGSTAGTAGIEEAYRLAERHWVEGGVNRVILATDGDFNVGVHEPDALEDFIARRRESGVYLSVLGFGMGNYHDALMQRLAQSGNGHAAYIDTLAEARKVLVDEATSMLFPIAKDVKIQVEFNPATVDEYRLIGYETRMLAREDFRNDKVDAGDIGAGHTVTALYELTPAGSDDARVPSLRYGKAEDGGAAMDFAGEIAFVKIRYKLPESETSTLITRVVTQADVVQSVEAATDDVRFATAVAAFGQLLRGGRYTGDYGYDDVAALARGARGEDPFGYRNELVGLVRLAQAIEGDGR